MSAIQLGLCLAMVLQFARRIINKGGSGNANPRRSNELRTAIRPGKDFIDGQVATLLADTPFGKAIDSGELKIAACDVRPGERPDTISCRILLNYPAPRYIRISGNVLPGRNSNFKTEEAP